MCHVLKQGSLRRSLRQAGSGSLSGWGTVGDVLLESCIVYAGVSVCVGVCLGGCHQVSGSMSGCLCHCQGWAEELSLRDMEVLMAIPVPSPFISGAAVMWIQPRP